MMRWLAIVLVVVACKQAKQVDSEPEPTAPSKPGHSVTKINAAEGSGGHAGSGEGSSDEVVKPPTAVGGNGSAASWGADGRPHGPGGPVFMGRGITCDAEHDHCMR